jgi:hypothetical protein
MQGVREWLPVREAEVRVPDWAGILSWIFLGGACGVGTGEDGVWVVASFTDYEGKSQCPVVLMSLTWTSGWMSRSISRRGLGRRIRLGRSGVRTRMT